jgi:hypothetical protein
LEDKREGERRGVDPKQAFGAQKPPVHLVPPILLVAAARAIAEGAAKYGAFNWRKSEPLKMTTYLGGMLRHLMAFLDGEEIDPESSTGKTHLEGLAASLAILLDARALGNLVDDRAPAGPVADLLRAPGYKKPAPPELVNIGEETSEPETVEAKTKLERLPLGGPILGG